MRFGMIGWNAESKMKAGSPNQEGDTVRGLGSVFAHFFTRTRWDRMFHQIR